MTSSQDNSIILYAYNEFNPITLYALSGEIIAQGPCSRSMIRQIKDFKNMSIKNPYSIIFIPCNTDIRLEFIDDLICSPYGTEFTVIYESIEKSTYCIKYGKSYCKEYIQNDWDDEEYDDHREDCAKCQHIEKINQSADDRNKRLRKKTLL